MKPFYLVLVVLGACCAYVLARSYHAPVSEIHDRNSVQIDNVIDATKMQHIVVHSCVTPDGSDCWLVEGVVVQ